MSPAELLAQYWGVIVSAAGMVIAWLLADASFKTKMTTLENQVTTSAAKIEANDTHFQSRFDVIAVQNANSIQDRAELHRLVDKLDASKASKEVVEAFKQEITILRLEMDKRFDRLDRMMEYRILRKEQKPDDFDINS